MICQREYTVGITSASECIDWTALGGWVDFGAPVIVGAGTLSFSHPTPNSWNQLALAPLGGALRWWDQIGSLMYVGAGDCDCNLEINCLQFAGVAPAVGVTIYVASVNILSPAIAMVGISNHPFTITGPGPKLVEVVLTTYATGPGGAAELTATLTTV